MEKCGLKYEGTAVQAEWNNSGAGDIAYYGLVVGPVVVEEPEEAEEPEIEEKEPKVIKTGRKMRSQMRQSSMSESLQN